MESDTDLRESKNTVTVTCKASLGHWSAFLVGPPARTTLCSSLPGLDLRFVTSACARTIYMAVSESQDVRGAAPTDPCPSCRRCPAWPKHGHVARPQAARLDAKLTTAIENFRVRSGMRGGAEFGYE